MPIWVVLFASALLSFAAWQLWRAIRRGVIRGRYVDWTRAAEPLPFYLYLVIYAAIALGIAVIMPWVVLARH